MRRVSASRCTEVQSKSILAVVGSSIGPNEPAIGRRKAHHVAQAIFDAEQVGEGRFHLSSEQEVLRPSLGFLVGFTTLRADAFEGFHFPPGFQSAVATNLAGIEVAVSEVQFPVGVFDVAHQVADAFFEVGQRDVVANAGDDHAVDLIGNPPPAACWKLCGPAMRLYCVPAPCNNG